MPAIPTPTLLSSTAGITLSGVFIGTSLTLTYITVPTLLLSAPKAQSTPSPSTPDPSTSPATSSGHLARQWLHMFTIGKAAGPVVSLASLGCWVYAARALPAAATLSKRLLVAGGVTNMMVVPFTLLFIDPTNSELTRRAKAFARGEEAKKWTGSVERMETDELVRKWGPLNVVRGGIQTLGIGLAVAGLVLA